MNTKDFNGLLDDVMRELTERNGTFERMFGKKDDEECEKLRYIAAIALMAADRYYSNLTRMEYELRLRGEVHKAVPAVKGNSEGGSENG